MALVTMAGLERVQPHRWRLGSLVDARRHTSTVLVPQLVGPAGGARVSGLTLTYAKQQS